MDVPALLSPEREFYLIKEKFWDWGSGDIYDERGNTIGRMKRKVLSLRSLITVMDLNGEPIFTINQKLASLRSCFDIKDKDGRLIGRTKKKILSLFRPKLWLEDQFGNQILEAQGSFAGWDFVIKDKTGRTLAEVRKLDRWRDVWLGGVFDFSDTYAVKVLEKNCDRRLVLGFVLAIDNSVHDR